MRINNQFYVVQAQTEALDIVPVPRRNSVKLVENHFLVLSFDPDAIVLNLKHKMAFLIVGSDHNLRVFVTVFHRVIHKIKYHIGNMHRIHYQFELTCF